MTKRDSSTVVLSGLLGSLLGAIIGNALWPFLRTPANQFGRIVEGIETLPITFGNMVERALSLPANWFMIIMQGFVVFSALLLTRYRPELSKPVKVFLLVFLGLFLIRFMMEWGLYSAGNTYGLAHYSLSTLGFVLQVLAVVGLAWLLGVAGLKVGKKMEGV